MGTCMPRKIQQSAKDLIPQDRLREALKRHMVPGVSLAWFRDGKLWTQAAGAAVTEGAASAPAKKLMTDKTFLEIASLSKTVASAFCIEYFNSKSIKLDKPVNELLTELKADFKLVAKAGAPKEWAGRVLLSHLMDHTGLGMHYVYGIPLKDPMPKPIDLMTGNKKYGYPVLEVEKEPGTRFNYSGGGFIMLQYIIELMEMRPVEEVMKPFIEKCEMDQFSVTCATVSGKDYAIGYLDDNKQVEGDRLMFPPYAAGMMGSPASLAKFLMKLGQAYKDPDCGGPISHETAKQMLNTASDKGSQKFMGAGMGLGVFVAKAGENSIALHQAANDGFRGLYLMAFDGPDAKKGPTGFVLLCNGNNNGMFLNCEVSRLALESLDLHGVDFSRVDGEAKGKGEFSIKNIKQEEIVNRGLKEMVFDAFVQ
mmetsp:Transcript_19190/g.31239  ORF Transcript_19190/g.31239 Transcript_19190/m.31239 type:complete len:423 (-) Transcript_19190:106-1374(-)